MEESKVLAPARQVRARTFFPLTMPDGRYRMLTPGEDFDCPASYVPGLRAAGLVEAMPPMPQLARTMLPASPETKG